MGRVPNQGTAHLSAPTRASTNTTNRSDTASPYAHGSTAEAGRRSTTTNGLPPVQAGF
jgi:hypothetical protein